MNRRIQFISYLTVAALVIVFLGAKLSSRSAQAGLLQDFLEQVLNQFSQEFFKPGPSVDVTDDGMPETLLYKPAVDYENAVVSAVEKASPAVVSVIVSKDLPVIERCPYNPFGNLPPEFSPFFDFGPFEFYQPCQKGTKKQEIGGGSGFIVSADGLIVTNKHVVADADAEYTVLTNDGNKYPAEVLASDPGLDLAVVKISAKNLPVLELGDSDAVKLGQTAIAIGNALGEFRNTVSVGVISGLARNVTARSGFDVETIEGVIQTDAAINPGNSGGPLLNLKGEVIGINTAVAFGAENIGFAIPINQAKKAIESVEKRGKIVRAFLGVRYINLTPEFSEKQNLPVEQGALLRGSEEGAAVFPDSPAAKAGLRAEDIILEVNGEEITSENSLASLIQKYDVGETISLKVRRGDDIIFITVTLDERPEL